MTEISVTQHVLHNISFVRGHMPPKLKVTREQIKEVSMKIAETSGIEAITARELGKRLGRAGG